MARDESVIGTVGVLIVATRGAAGPGEVRVRIRGGSESFLAWSAIPLPKGTTVLVLDCPCGVVMWSRIRGQVLMDCRPEGTKSRKIPWERKRPS